MPVATDPLSGTLGCAGIGGLYVGAKGASSGHFDGAIDDVQIYDHALNAAQINAVYFPHPIP